MNSNPEKLMLTELLDKKYLSVYFWDEPSNLRKNGPKFQAEKAYTNILVNIHSLIEEMQPKLLIGSSFGAQICIDYIRKHKIDNDIKFLFICPTLDMNTVMRKMIEISEKDFQISNIEQATKLKELRKKINSFNDEFMQKAMELVWQNINLPQHYFCNKVVLQKWIEGFSEPNYAMDFEAAAAVLNEFKDYKSMKLGNKLNNKMKVIFGEKDPVIDRELMLNHLKSVFNYIEESLFSETGHFPHLEQSEKFIEEVEKILS